MRNALIILLFLGSLFTSISAQPYDDSLSVDRHLIKISQVEYLNAILAEANRTRHDSLDPLSARGLTLDANCDEICESYLMDRKSKKKKLLPSNFDQGIIKLLFSPPKNRFVIFSSYDGPDYTNYYFYRAEIIVFDAPNKQGLEQVKEQSHFHLYKWSIEDLVWLDPQTLALKLYSDPRNPNGGFEYFKLKI